MATKTTHSLLNHAKAV